MPWAVFVLLGILVDYASAQEPEETPVTPAEPPAAESATDEADAPKLPPAEKRPESDALATPDGAAAPDEPGATADAEKSDAPAIKEPPKLQFSFTHTRWIDVLEWLAEQADLSLVLDAPPPGSFNYSDTRKYTPTEAIDRVNSVLWAKGYTLVLRDRMLHLVSLVGGVPRAMLPRVSLDEIDRRGEFEMVSVAFPVGKRPLDTVIKEIEVLIGPHGDIAQLPASTQVMVTDRAGIMRVIGTVIDSIPEPAPKPAVVEKQEYKNYPLQGTEPGAVLETLKSLFGSIPFVHDTKADHINTYATPTQHKAIQAIFDQMQGGAPQGHQPRLEGYPLLNLDPTAITDLQSNLAMVAPTARIRFDEKSERLFVWAKAVEQDAIRAAVVKLLQAAPQLGDRLPLVYRLERTDPTALQALLQNTLPRATITVDPKRRQVIVLGSQLDHQVAGQLIQQIDAALPDDLRPVLRIYPVDRRMADRVTSLVARFAPDAEATVDPKLGQATVIATPVDHEQIEPLLKQLSEASVQLPSATVEVVKVPEDLVSRFQTLRALIEAEVPDAKMLWNEEAHELTVWATPDDHVRVGTFMEQLSRQSPTLPTERTVKVLSVPREIRERFEAVQALLIAEVPAAKLAWDPKRLELTVWGMPKELARVGVVLEQMKMLPPQTPPKLTLQVHKLSKELKERYESIRKILTAEAPEAQVNWEPTTLELNVLAMAEDHERIGEILDQVSGLEVAATPKPTFHVYQLPKGQKDRFESLQQLLATEVPEAKLTWDSTMGELTVWAVEEDHERVREIVEQLTEQPVSAPVKPTVEVYTLGKELRLRFESIREALAAEVPDATLTWDSESTELTVWALADDHERIRELLAQISQRPPPADERTLMIYSIGSSDPDVLVAMLLNVVKQAKITADAKGRRILVWGTPKEHAAIGVALQRLSGDQRSGGDRTYQSHPVGGIELTLATKLLTEQLPGLTFEPDAARSALIAFASAEEHEEIRKTLEDMQTSPEDAGRRVVVYPTDYRSSEAVMNTLEEMLPGAKVFGIRDRPNVSVHGTDAEHELAKEVVDQWNRNRRQLDQPIAKAYILKHLAAEEVSQQLVQLVPGGQFSAGSSPNQLLARAPVEEHELIAELLAQIDQPTEDQGKVVALYKLADQNLTQFASLLDQRTVSQIYYVSGGRDRLIVRATPEYQEKVKGIIDQLAPIVVDQTRLVLYPIEHANPQEAWSIISQIVPRASVTVQAEARTLAVTTVDEDHEKIVKTLEVIDQPSGDQGKAVAVYKLADRNLPQFASLIDRQTASQIYYVSGGRDRVIVRATPKYQEKVKGIIDQLTPILDAEPHLVLYPIKHADPQEVWSIIRQSVPLAVGVVQTELQSLAVSAVDVDHEKIVEALQLIDQPAENIEKKQITIVPIESAEPQQLVSLLQRTYATERNLFFSYDPKSRSIMMIGRPERHEEIKQIIAAIDLNETERRGYVVVYAVDSTDATTAATMLRSVAPNALITPDIQGHRILVWATAKEHEALEKTVKAMDGEISAGGDRTFMPHPVGGLDPALVLRLLTIRLPGVTFDQDTKRNALIAYATAEQHEQIDAILKDMQAMPEEAESRQVVVYPTDAASSEAIGEGLQQLLPSADIIARNYRPNVSVRGTAAEQRLAKEFVDQWNAVRLGLDRPTAVVYELKHLPAEEVQTQLVRLVPKGIYTVGATPNQLLARGSAEVHELITQLLEQIDKQEVEDNKVVAVYELPGRNYSSLRRLFDERLMAQIQLAPGGRDYVIVRATPENQAKVQRVIDQVAPVIDHKPETVVYRMQHADPLEVSRVLRGVAPDASVTVQTESQSLAVLAYDKDHERISEAIRAIDRPAEQSRERQICVVPIESAEPQQLLALLTKTYRSQRDLNFSYDASTHSILIIGRPDQHEEIKQIIAGADAAEKEPQTDVVVYSLGRIQGSIVRRMLQDIMVKENILPSLSLESNGNRLIAKATQKQHAMIRQVLDQLRPQEIDFEMFSLEVIDPLTADQIISRMFTSSTEGGMPPVVDADTANYRLYVRATSEQIERIRKLLTRMGEKHLSGTESDGQELGGQTRVRFVPLLDDPEAALKSIREVWSRLRKNELRLLKPGDELPPEVDSGLLKKKQDASPADSLPAQPGDAEQGTLNVPRPNWGDLHWAGLALLGPVCQVVAGDEAIGDRPQATVEKPQATGDGQAAAGDGEQEQAAGDGGQAAGEGPEATGQRPQAKDNGQEPVAGSGEETGSREQGGVSEPAEKAELPPVYILAGDRGVTLMSEDIDALNQLEQLFATVARPQSWEGGRRFFVYTLKSAMATRLATTLNKLYRYVPSYGSSYRSRSRRNQSTAFVADDRLNSLIIFANRGDRDEIVELLEILDAEQSPDLQETKRPVVIPLEHARVETVEKQIKSLYKTQLTAGGKQPVMEIPSGTDAVVAAMIEQVNAIRQGPLMTLDVDLETNSLLVAAPAALLKDVKTFVESLDQSASENPRRAVRIMSLKEINADEMDRALQRILRDRRR